jgi:hypothetical protein
MAQRSPDVEMIIVQNMNPLACIDCEAEGAWLIDVLGGRINGWTVTRQLECRPCGLRWTQVIDRRRIDPKAAA